MREMILLVNNAKASRGITTPDPTSKIEGGGSVVSVNELTASWSMENTKLVLSDISFSVGKVWQCLIQPL